MFPSSSHLRRHALRKLLNKKAILFPCRTLRFLPRPSPTCLNDHRFPISCPHARIETSQLVLTASMMGQVGIPNVSITDNYVSGPHIMYEIRVEVGGYDWKLARR